MSVGRMFFNHDSASLAVVYYPQDGGTKGSCLGYCSRTMWRPRSETRRVGLPPGQSWRQPCGAQYMHWCRGGIQYFVTPLNLLTSPASLQARYCLRQEARVNCRPHATLESEKSTQLQFCLQPCTSRGHSICGHPGLRCCAILPRAPANTSILYVVSLMAACCSPLRATSHGLTWHADEPKYRGELGMPHRQLRARR